MQQLHPWNKAVVLLRPSVRPPLLCTQESWVLFHILSPVYCNYEQLTWPTNYNAGSIQYKEPVDCSFSSSWHTMIPYVYSTKTTTFSWYRKHQLVYGRLCVYSNPNNHSLASWVRLHETVYLFLPFSLRSTPISVHVYIQVVPRLIRKP